MSKKNAAREKELKRRQQQLRDRAGQVREQRTSRPKLTDTQLHLEALREQHIEQAMNDPFRVFVLNPQSNSPEPLHTIFPNEIALMLVNCLDGKTTRVSSFTDPDVVFNRKIEDDGTVVVNSSDLTFDLYFASELSESHRAELMSRAESAQAAF